MIDALDSAVQQLRRNRTDVIRIAVEHCPQDFEALSVAVDRLRDPGDTLLDRVPVRREHPDTDQGECRQGVSACDEAQDTGIADHREIRYRVLPSKAMSSSWPWRASSSSAIARSRSLRCL